MANPVAVILAAGFSRRMGARNKLLLPIGDVPMIRHMVDIYSQVARSVIVVTGHEADAVDTALDGSGAQTVFNKEFEQGQSTSVACGLRAVPETAPVLIGLGDQPLLCSNDLRDLLDAHHTGDTTRISIPTHNAQRGNPIIIPPALRRRVLADPKSPGCKTFTRAFPEHIQCHLLPARGFYADVDTPETYDALMSRALEETL